jgi:hypothetical protein
MATLYAVAFSQTDPRTYPSLAPTFLTFKKISDGSDISPPTIAQMSTSGLYFFTYTASFSVYFLLDGVTVNASSDRYVYGVLDPVHQVDKQLAELSSTLSGYNNTLAALGTTSVALGTSMVALGTSNFAWGNSNYALGVSNYAWGNTNFAIGTTIQSMVGVNSSLITSLDTKIGSTLSSFGTTSVDPGDLFGYLKRAQEFREGDQTFNKVTGAWDISTRGGTLLIQKTLTQSSSSVTKT